MHITNLVFGGVIGALVVLSLGASIPPKKLEYRHARGWQSDENLNKLADEGWALVCTGTSEGTLFYVLTRPRQ